MATNSVQSLDASAIQEKAQNVFVDLKALDNIAEQLINYITWNATNKNLTEVATNFVRFSPEFHPDRDDHRAADWLLVLNTLNFSLWNPKNAKQWTVDGLTGYHALSAAIKRAIDEDKPIWDPYYYSVLSESDAEIIFRGDDSETGIPLLDRRIEILHKIGNILVNVYKGTFVECLKICERDPDKMLLLIIELFESYQDEIDYKGDMVRHVTKAKMLLQDIWVYFKDHEFGLNFDKQFITSTAFMDYRIFQVFYHFKALRYSKRLITKFKNEDPVEQGSEEEIEIRSCTLYALEELHIKMLKMCIDWVKKIPELKKDNFHSVILMDNFLWDYRQRHDEELKESVPFHFIITEQY